MKRKQFIILILLLVIGFASVTTTLVLNGNIGVGVELDDFDVIFVEALLDGKEDTKATISEDKKTITFTTDKFVNPGDSTRLNYKVKNTSTQYDADVTINCTNENSEYVTVTSEFDGNSLPLENLVNIKAQEVKSGYINAELTKAYPGDDTSIEIVCSIVFTATSREEYAYSLSFNSNGGSKIDDKSVVLNDSYGELATPEREGYNFLGWYDENDVKVDENTIFNNKGDKTLYAKWAPICPYEVGQVWTFDYTGGEQEFTVPCDGNYKLETWGAQGGYAYSTSFRGGYGGYSEGILTVDFNETLFVNVGGTGSSCNSTSTTNRCTAVGGYNGGGYSIDRSSSVCHVIGAGGGATHIALESGLLKDLSAYANKNTSPIVIVSGGGGGAFYNTASSRVYARGTGGSGGGFKGVDGYGEYGGFGGEQTKPGLANPYSETNISGFGYASSDSLSNILHEHGTGGGGYYGGGSGYSGAGGGSGYIGNLLLTNKAMYCYNCEESSEESTKTISTTCTSSIPTANCAKQGNSYAKITLVSVDS